MLLRICKTAVCITAGLFCLAPAASAQQQKQKQHAQEKTVWNYDGGVLFETDGTLPTGACFRISGRLNAPHFFENLKRVDTEDGTVFRRGSESVTRFPEALLVSYIIRDQPCTLGLEKISAQVYLTQQMMDSMKVSLYWKHGVDLQPVKNAGDLRYRVDRVVPYATTLAAELPSRYEWSYQLVVPSTGISLSESLVFVFRSPGDRIAARVAARM